jgi:NAD(P)-dependent dehydrogenase (short-subunit alcohol dehydrogenase family)
MASRVLVVTGAARGIGAATALLAGRAGYPVCVNYRANHDAATRVVRSIQDAGGTAVAVQADVADQAQVHRLFEEADRMGPLGGLVNNAGVLETQARVEEIDAARLQRVLATNVIGPFLCAKAAVTRLSTRHGGAGGSIVNVSSVAARTGSPNEYVDYAASKGALDTFTIGLAHEVAAEGVRVNGVRAGFIYTQMHADGGEPGRVDRVKAFVPMRRGGQPQEVAHAILWLLSDDAAYTTGSFIEVAGGR